MKKVIMLGSVLLIAVFLAGCSQQSVSQTQPTTPASVAQPDETVNWKTYTNTDYGYSIKYPSTWTVDLASKDSRGKTLSTFLAPGQNNAPHDKIVDIQVSPTTNVSRVDSADYIKRNGNVIISTSPVVVGGVSTDKFSINLNNGYNMEVYVEKNSETYILGLHNTTSSDKEYIDNFNLMLSSFKFTNVTNNTSYYNSSAQNISFDYPSNWKVNENQTSKSITVTSPPTEDAGTFITVTIPAESFDEFESTNKALIQSNTMSIQTTKITTKKNDYPTRAYGLEGSLYYLIQADGHFVSVGSERYMTKVQEEGLGIILDSVSF